jgi:putative acetyltransferase
MEKLTFQPGDLGNARNLIEELDTYLLRLYPAESNHLLSIESLRQPNVTFLIALFNLKVVGCGAFVNHCGEYGEIKRMFVLPDLRGKGIGLSILKQLENRARLAGITLCRLETGVSQPEALRLYVRSGYQRRGSFPHTLMIHLVYLWRRI